MFLSIFLTLVMHLVGLSNHALATPTLHAIGAPAAPSTSTSPKMHAADSGGGAGTDDAGGGPPI